MLPAFAAGKMLQQSYYSVSLMKFCTEVSVQRLDASNWKPGWQCRMLSGSLCHRREWKKLKKNKNSRASCIILIQHRTLLVAVSPAGRSEPFCLTLLLFDGLHKSNFTPPNREQKVWNSSLKPRDWWRHLPQSPVVGSSHLEEASVSLDNRLTESFYTRSFPSLLRVFLPPNLTCQHKCIL